jgi:hypothetical protein
MRWLLIAFVASLAALLFASAGLARHIWKQRTRQGGEVAASPEGHHEPEVKTKG